MSEAKWYLRTQDETFGPETEQRLVEWARLGRIQPGQEVSDDNEIWQRAEDVPFLDMRFSIDLGDGNPRGPFNRAAAEALLASGRLPPTASIVESRGPFSEPEPDFAPEPEPVPAPAAASAPVPAPRVVIKEVVREVPVEKIVEKVIEKEVVKTVVDEARVKQLEAMLAAASRVVGENENALKDAVDRERKLQEQICALEDELRRLPQSASEVADVQTAVYSIMTSEAEELAAIIEAEKRESDEFRRRHEERADRLLERRRLLLKRAGSNIEDMTRKALIERPEDPRTARLRKELDDLTRLDEKKSQESVRRIRDLEEALKAARTESSRAAEGMRDVTQLRSELEALRSKLQLREQELLAERQKTETLRQHQATSQQALMARLTELESPSFGTPQALATNQSREAKLVKLPSWMHLKK